MTKKKLFELLKEKAAQCEQSRNKRWAYREYDSEYECERRELKEHFQDYFKKKKENEMHNEKKKIWDDLGDL